MFTNCESRENGKAIIVASGPSSCGFIPPTNVTIIAVNGAIQWLPRADYFFTLDVSAENRNRLEKPRPGVNYFAAVTPDVILPSHVRRLRRVSARGVEPKPKGTPEWWFWRWSCVECLSENPGDIHNGNSAWGALGLAYHLGFRNVALVGVDATNEERIEGGRSNNLTHLPLLFSSALSQLNVVSCGRMSGIPQITFKEWLNEDIDCR